jgi:hypothetical protein
MRLAQFQNIYKMRTGFISCLLLLLSFTSFAGAKKQASTVLANANKMAKAFLSKDYIAYSKYSYYQHPNPSQEEEDKLAGIVAKHMYDLELQNNIMIDMKFAEPTKIVHAGTELQCVVPVTMKTKIKGGVITSYTNMIAFSYDKGHSWHFMDMGNKSLESLRTQYSDISPDLIVPAKKDESFLSDDPNKR